MIFSVQVEALLNVFISAQDHQGHAAGQQGTGGNGEIQVTFLPDTHNAHIVFFSDIDLDDGFASPILRHGDLINAIFSVQLHIVEKMVRTVADGSPVGKLLFRIDDLIGTVSQQKLLLHIGGCPGDYHPGAQFLEQRGGFQGALEIIADGNNTGIVVIHPQGPEKIGVGAVTDLSRGYIGKYILYKTFILIYSHDLMA